MHSIDTEGMQMTKTEASKSAAINREGERLIDSQGNLVGWIADDTLKFHPCGASLTAEQLRAILGLIDAAKATTGSAQ